MPRNQAIQRLRDGCKYFAPVSRLAMGNRKEHCAQALVLLQGEPMPYRKLVGKKEH